MQKKAILCDKSKEAIQIINKNVQKTHLQDKAEIYNMDFKTAIKKLKNQEFDIIYIDPPYVTDYVKIAIEEIVKNKLVNTNTKIIIETDEEERILKQIENINVKVVDKRKYGRATIIFLEHIRTDT